MDKPRNQGVFDSPHAHIADSFNVYQQKPPPPDHPNAITCIQCDELTWRMTDCCIHCGFNITAHTHEQARLQKLQELKTYYNHQRKKALLLFIPIIMCFIGMVLCLFMKPLNLYLYWLPAGIIVIVFLFFKPIAEDMKEVGTQIKALTTHY